MTDSEFLYGIFNVLNDDYTVGITDDDLDRIKRIAIGLEDEERLKAKVEKLKKKLAEKDEEIERLRDCIMEASIQSNPSAIAEILSDARKSFKQPASQSGDKEETGATQASESFEDGVDHRGETD